LHSDRFRQRSAELLRVEALCDAIFGFSVSLLIFSLEVPQTFADLRHILHGGIPFFFTVALLFLLWYQQYLFYRHYGLSDAVTTVLNLAYMTLILFYLYPMKFLFSLLLSMATGQNFFPEAAGHTVLTQAELPQLVLLFSAGYATIWFLLWLMHYRVKFYSHELQLSAWEKLYTQKETSGALFNMMVGLAASIFALLGWPVAAGICFLFIPVLLLLNGRRFHNMEKRLPKAG